MEGMQVIESSKQAQEIGESELSLCECSVVLLKLSWGFKAL